MKQFKNIILIAIGILFLNACNAKAKTETETEYIYILDGVLKCVSYETYGRNCEKFEYYKVKQKDNKDNATKKSDIVRKRIIK